MQIAYGSDIGKNRSMNEDYVSWFKNQQNQPLMLICDGMGGHQAGDVASEMAVSHLGEAWKKTSFSQAESVSSWFLTTIQKVNQLIFQKSLDFVDLDGMGTTLVAAAVVAGELVVAHIGDSRAYLYRNYQLKQLTEDHSLVNELVKSGELSETEAKNHPQKNIVTRSMGNREKIQIDLTSVPIKKNDFLVLCTDGLSNLVDEEGLKRVLKDWMSLPDKVTKLIEMANEAGGSDNISVLIAHFIEKEEG
ncbi:Stp1/IreP family PP2C-type Ser/Thr phosphatase [Jeotgalibaca caeni]|uniref:Stp1/IreP family PP2C-type Ser/Thr phosphatase n=1 Tax=Jeotgalibaca caeni TaxID=3028623 RepID=UPI00237D34B8|nr:Stp1/IreP family PP2C-type Ser/Thr phosphatase [Jeotgalibaca caeni]MDE1548017.1 Stp1/IreP family PP2C-type Ser/Thr phosphatase [Jeotgalibaca caeni]